MSEYIVMFRSVKAENGHWWAQEGDAFTDLDKAKEAAKKLSVLLVGATRVYDTGNAISICWYNEALKTSLHA